MTAQFIELAGQFPDALLCGLLIGAVCSVFGVFVILKRVVFISMALSETAAFGAALSMLVPLTFIPSQCTCGSCCGVTRLNPLVGSAALTLLAVLALSIDFESRRIPRDAVLGLVFLTASSLSILLVSGSGFGLEEIKSLLYGDLVLARPKDTAVVAAVCLPSLGGLIACIRPVLYTFIDRDAARVMRIRVKLWESLFFAALGLIVSAASQTAGALLVFCYLAVVPATALLLSGRMAAVLATAPLLAAASTVAGMTFAYAKDLPANQTITVCAGALFIAAAALRQAAGVIGRAAKRRRAAHGD